MKAFAHPRLIEAATVPEHVVDHRLPDDLRQELVHDQPVVVPRRQPAARDQMSSHPCSRAARPVDRVVVEEDESALQAGNDQVLVVARVRNDRGVRAAVDPRQVSNRPPKSIRSLSWSAGS
jgi:hypothetical protein